MSARQLTIELDNFKKHHAVATGDPQARLWAALEAGRALVRCRPHVQGTPWKAWLSEHVTIPTETAYRYYRFAQCNAHLEGPEQAAELYPKGLTAAYRHCGLLPEKKAPTPPEQDEDPVANDLADFPSTFLRTSEQGVYLVRCTLVNTHAEGEIGPRIETTLRTRDRDEAVMRAVVALSILRKLELLPPRTVAAFERFQTDLGKYADQSAT